MILRDDKVQLSVTGKGGKMRQVLLPEIVSASLLALRGDAGANDPVFASHKGARLKQRAIGYMIKRAAKRAGIAEYRLRPLAAPRPRIACARPRRHPCRGAGDARPRQRGDDERLSARAAEHLERAQAGRGHISLRKTTRVRERSDTVSTA